MITDYLITCFGVYFFFQLFTCDLEGRQKSIRLWSYVFLFIGLSSFLGGTVHGFKLIMSSELKTFLWRFMAYVIGLVSLFVVLGTSISSVKRPVRDIIWGLFFAKFLFYIYWMSTHHEFKYVIMDYAPSMLFILALQVYAKMKLKSESAIWIISGVVVTFFAAAVQRSNYDFHHYFNHNDLYHLIQISGLYLFYRGVRLLKDLETKTS